MIINKNFDLNDTPLHLATKSSGSMEEMRTLLQKGVDINAKNKAGWAPLHIAVAENSYGKAKMLLDAGADVNATIDRQEDDTPLHLAAGANNVKMARLLIKYGASLSMYGEEGTPLEVARRNRSRQVEYLLQRELNRREAIRPRISARGPERVIAHKLQFRHYSAEKTRV